MTKSVAFTFGRFNPPTTGHEKLMDKTRGANRNYRIYASQSQDPKRNPLRHKNKVSLMKGMFPAHSRKISTDKMTTAIDAMVNLYKEKYTDVLMVVGSYRVAEFDALVANMHRRTLDDLFHLALTAPAERAARFRDCNGIPCASRWALKSDDS